MTEKEASLPLQQLEVDGEPKVKSGKGAFSGLFLNKIKLIALAVVILILVIIIIVLGAVLGHERSKDRRETKTGKEGNEEEVGPTSVGPTKPGTGPTSVGPTTPGTGPRWKIRLPDNVKPYHYDLGLHIDLTRPTFNGNVSIWINVSRDTRYLLLHATHMIFTRAEVRKVFGGEIPIKRHFEFEKNQFHVIELESSVGQGMYIVTVEFTGNYSGDLRGLYKASFKDKNGAESFFAATQFEPLRARRAFPCFDEPAMKATFNVTIVHDPRLIALSNMPIYQSSEKEGWKYDQFEKTVKMSTYLVAFSVGDFKYKETKTDKGVVIRIYARAEVLDQVDYPLKISNQSMMYFEEFFGVPYSLPKSDGMALPAFGPSGMENWGLIKYKETSFLLKDGEASALSMESVAKLVAHEMGHQWFGNIVTMKWWNDLWLNEGFASYVSAVGIEHIHSNWKIIDQFIARSVHYALELDGLASSHPVRPTVEDPAKILELFDPISYLKGGSVLLMLHRFLGDTVFRAGLKRYLTKHAYGNADTDDLWTAMTQASKDAGKDTDVGEMMSTFILQMGYPVVSITKSSKPNTFEAEQQRFLYHRHPNANHSTSPYGYKWIIPFYYYTGTYDTSTPPSNTSLKIIDKDSADISWSGQGWIKGNIGQIGFYRVNYYDDNWRALARQLNANHKVINAVDRAGLIDDSYNLARANMLNHTFPLHLSTYLTKEEDYVPLLAATEEFSTIMKILPTTRPVFKYLQKFVAFLTRKQYAKLGMENKGTHMEQLTRTLLLKANCLAGVSSCLSNMTKMFRLWMEDPVTNAVPANLKEVVYHFGVMNGGEEEWNFAFQQFTTTNAVSDKNALLYAMAGSQEPWLIERYLNYALDSSKIGPLYMYYVFYYITDSNAMGTNAAWNFLRLRFDEISKLSGSPRSALSRYIPFISNRFSADYQLEQLQDFVNSVMKDEVLPWSVKQAIERVKVNIQWRNTHEEDVKDWLLNFFKSMPEFSTSK